MLDRINKRGSVRFGIPEELKMPLIFTIFFAVVGISIKSISAGELVFFDFFVGDYSEWFKSFGGFTERIKTAGAEEFFFSLLKSWYYFFYTGGLLSLVWGFLSWLLHLEWAFSDSNKYESSEHFQDSVPKKTIPKIEDILKKEGEFKQDESQFKETH
jgi:hypothetical protein